MASPTLQDRRTWMVGGVLVALVLALAGWMLLVKPERSSTSDLVSRTQSVDAQNAAVAAQNAALLREYHHLNRYRDELAKAADALPGVSGLPSFTREVTLLAARHSVSVQGITVGAIAPLTQPAVAPADTTTTSGTTDTPAPTPSTTAPAADTTSTSNVFTIAVTLQTQGSTADLTAYLHAVEAGARAVVVNSVQLSTSSGGSAPTSSAASSPSDAAGQTTMTAQLTLFSAPMSASERHELNSLLRSGH
jgi:hypothetical protein